MGNCITTVVEQKAAIRKSVLEKRNSLDEELRNGKSALVCEMVKRAFIETAEKSVLAPTRVAVYSAMKSELSLDPFIRFAYARGATVCFPCMTAVTPEDKAASIPTASGKRLSRMVMRAVAEEAYSESTIRFVNKPLSIWDIDDPLLDEYLIMDPLDIDMLVVPVVAFDGEGRRLGYGGGNYDSIFPLLDEKCRIMGVAFEEQRVDSIPCEDHDLPLPSIITS